MQPEPEDVKLAGELLARHGDQAETFAGTVGDQCLSDGDPSGFRKWCRVILAIQTLRRNFPLH
jgi:hypothetical protein